MLLRQGFFGFYALDSNMRINLDGVRGVGNKRALFIGLMECVLFLRVVLLWLEVHRSSGCTGPTGS